MKITAADYKRVRTELRGDCPSRAFPAIPDNCWVDSTMFGLTFAPDIGRVMRAALLGCLDNLEAAGVRDTDAFYAHVATWKLEPVWNTYITRMLLFFLLGAKAAEELTCPLVKKWVEDFRKRTFDVVKIPVAEKGGITQEAIPAILTSLSVDDDIQIVLTQKHGTFAYSGKDYKHVAKPDFSSFVPRIRHYSVKTDNNAGHVIVGFLCEKRKKVILYDNNFGLTEFKNLKAIPDEIQIEYTKISGVQPDITFWYTHTVKYIALNNEKEVDSVSKTFGILDKSKPNKITVDVPLSTVTLYTKSVYDRVRRGEDILATMLGAPTAKRLTVGPATPRIADVKSPSKREEMSSPASKYPSLTPSVASYNSEFMEEENESTSRISKFASCVREMAATVPYKRTQLFNAPGWDASKLNSQQLLLMSSKFRTLLETIRRVDAADMKKHGKLFKHFIFTDLRSSAYGAKAIGTFLAAHGFELLFKAEKGFRRRKVKGADKKPVLGADGKPTYRMEETKKLKITLATHQPVEGGSQRVGLLQGNPLWKSQIGIDVRKQMLGVFNSRPDNIHGEQIRFMVLDSKFKEGIDLYDVKYVHLMEPAITEADLKQAIGRATRYCGQRGLNFVPNVGWPLEVYMYETQFGNTYPFRTSGTAKVFDAHKYMMAHSGLDLGLLEMTRNLTVLAIKSAVDYDLTYKINNFKMAAEIRDLTDLDEAIILSVSPQTGGVSAVLSGKGFDRSKCLPRSNKFFPFTVARIKDAFRARGIDGVSNADRKKLCAMLEAHEEVMQDLLTGRKVSAVKPALPTGSPIIPSSTAAPTPNTEARTANSVKGLPRTPYYELFPKPEKPARLTKAELEEMPDLADFFAAHELAAEADYVAQRASFAEFQDFIRRRYAAYGWESPVVKSACDTVMPMGQPVQFSKSQDFVRHYLTPASPFAGLLAWHSVGTGKTCTAVATATSEFEKAGYSILWVTRNSLMADVWKNVFGAVCSVPIQEYVQAGKKIPARLGTRKRLLSKAWFDPISYRSLQNALVPPKKGKRKGQITKLGKILRERNGGTDPLRKTFLIIDEIHKLLDGDLKASEKADFDEIAAAIHHSYKVSGKDAVKLLLMTATPITDNPEGLFRMLNLLIPAESRRLPTVEEFRAKYTKADGTITEEGEAFFQSHVKGLISYLNREFDPTAFAQPHFHQVKVKATGAEMASDGAIVRQCLAEEAGEDLEEIDCNVDGLKAELEAEMDALAEEELTRTELAARKRTLKADYKSRIDACKARIKTRKAAVKNMEKRVGACITQKAKTRKTDWKFSQQKAVKKCFGKAFHGEPPAFSSIADLKRMAKSGRPASSSRSSRGSVKSTRARKGPLTGTPVRSLTPNRNRYGKKTRKVKKASVMTNNSGSTSRSSRGSSRRR